MDRLSIEWRERFERVWDPAGQGRYRQGSPGQRLAARFAEHLPAGCIVNDYGCGTGRPVAALKKLRPDLTVNMVDIAGNALEDEARSLIGAGATFTQASLWDLPEGFPLADWGYCIDVLMTLPPRRLDGVLREIRRTCRNLFCQVYDWDDIRLGLNYTTIAAPAEWWELKLRERWNRVDRQPSAEHKRRYIFVCGGEP